MNANYVSEQLDILRRNCDSGMKICPENMVDLFQHMKDEIERLRLYVENA